MEALQNYFLSISIGLLFLFLVSCNSKDVNDTQGSDNLVLHPIEERIPNYGDEHINIDYNNNFSELEEKPEQLATFQKYLENPQAFKEKKLHVNVGSSLYTSFNVISIGSERLVILDPDNDALLEYDLKSSKASTIAQVGRGPGDIMYVKGMKKSQDYIYVLEGNMRLSRFNYHEKPTKFSEVIQLNFNPFSIAISDTSLATLGIPKIGNTSDNKIEGYQDFRAVSLLNKEGNKVSQFGDIYGFEGHWMLLRPFVSSGFVKYNPKEELYVVAYRPFPFLYVYDATTLKLQKTYKISSFNLGKRKYWPDQGKLEVKKEDHSSINNSKLIDDKFLWLEIAQREKKGEGKWDQKMDYYVVNLSNDESYYLGKLNTGGDIPNQQFFLTENGLIIQKQGNLYQLTKRS